MTTLFIVLIASLAALVILGLYLSIRYSSPDMTAYDSPLPPLVKRDEDISDGHEQVIEALARYHAIPDEGNVTAGRKKFEDFFGQEVDVPVKAVDVDGISAEWVIPQGSDPYNRILYIHGGAFLVGSPKSHRFITAELARRTGACVLAIDYRLQPEVKTIVCHEDARTAYRWVLENGPDGPAPAENLFVAGDSAGGNLTLAVIAWARDNKLRIADGAITFAPLTDATMSGPTWAANIACDHFLGPSIGRVLKIPKILRLLGSRMQGGLPPNHPELSPLLGHLGGLPPTLIQVSRDEMLFGDAVRYANKAKAEGGRVTLQAWPKLSHVFQGFAFLPEAGEALGLASDFIREIIKGKMAQTRIG